MDYVLLACVVAVVLGILGVVMSQRSKEAPGIIQPTQIKKAVVTDEPETGDLVPIHVYYGSQTGTAEGFSKQIANDARRNGFKATVVDLEGVDGPEFVARATAAGSHPHTALFIMATYGEGDPTDNAVTLTRWIKDLTLPTHTLNGLRFAVFGLGNRQYEHFNAMGRLFQRRLGELGGACVYGYGEGDDDGTLEDDFNAWKDGLWAGLAQALGVAGGGAAVATPGPPAELPPLSWSVHWIATPDAAHQDNNAIAAAARTALANKTIEVDQTSKYYFTAKPCTVTVNRELRQSFSRGNSTRHIEIDLSGSGLHYATADDLAVLPDNNAASVAQLAKWLGYEGDLDRWFVLEQAPGATEGAKSLFPSPCTVRTAMTSYIDIHGQPRKQLLSYLAVLATNTTEKQRLQLLASREGKGEYQRWVVDEQRAIWEVFQEFPSVQPSFEQFIQLLPPLTPRWYTIASSSVAHPNTVHLAVSEVFEPNKPGAVKGRSHAGVCSSFLSSAQPGTQLRCDLRSSNFKLPPNTSEPVVMVGPGTGIAPMRAFIQERAFQIEQGSPVGPMVLFFGCRRQDEDYIYADELSRAVENGTLSELIVAFSRAQAHKVYVQHKLKAHGADVWRMLSQEGGHLYVCGATAMGDDVKHAITDIAVEFGGLTAGDAAEWVKALGSRYIVELW